MRGSSSTATIASAASHVKRLVASAAEPLGQGKARERESPPIDWPSAASATTQYLAFKLHRYWGMLQGYARAIQLLSTSLAELNLHTLNKIPHRWNSGYPKVAAFRLIFAGCTVWCVRIG